MVTKHNIYSRIDLKQKFLTCAIKYKAKTVALMIKMIPYKCLQSVSADRAIQYIVSRFC